MRTKMIPTCLLTACETPGDLQNPNVRTTNQSIAR